MQPEYKLSYSFEAYRIYKANLQNPEVLIDLSKCG
jgi:hypothetical protein